MQTKYQKLATYCNIIGIASLLIYLILCLSLNSYNVLYLFRIISALIATVCYAILFGAGKMVEANYDNMFHTIVCLIIGIIGIISTTISMIK